jgi:hypothetical protein
MKKPESSRYIWDLKKHGVLEDASTNNKLNGRISSLSVSVLRKDFFGHVNVWVLRSLCLRFVMENSLN